MSSPRSNKVEDTPKSEYSKAFKFFNYIVLYFICRTKRNSSPPRREDPVSPPCLTWAQPTRREATGWDASTSSSPASAMLWGSGTYGGSPISAIGMEAVSAFLMYLFMYLCILIMRSHKTKKSLRCGEALSKSPIVTRPPWCHHIV